jgi:hypothetical protein
MASLQSARAEFGDLLPNGDNAGEKIDVLGELGKRIGVQFLGVKEFQCVIATI